MTRIKQKGFTLIELLAVIVILAIIALIAVPIIMNIINSANKSAFKDTAYGVIQAGEYYFTEQQLEPNGMVNDIKIKLSDNILQLKGNVPDGEVIITTDGKVSIAVKNERYCAIKGLDDIDVTITEDLENCVLPDGGENLYVDSVLNGADPILRTGMIPVVISADGTVKKADTTKEWYNYTNQEWANAVLVDSDSRENYKTMAAGEPIQESDILAYFVWIPRYKYKLWYVEAADSSTSLDTSKVHSIDIVFENKGTDKSDGTCNRTNEDPTNGCYLTHPAFTFDEEINGIWVGKFETGYSGANSKEESWVNEENSSKVIIKPNVYAWARNNVSNMFYSALHMDSSETLFGLKNDSDTHMMKNTEWGAVTYLTYSKYGREAEDGKVIEVYKNNRTDGWTGCGGDEPWTSTDYPCSNLYGSRNDNVYNQSTTGNISGIFDMSAGLWELVMGYGKGGTDEYGTSGFTDETFPEAKYVDVYISTGATNYSNRILGDATGEMGPFKSFSGSWYDDYAATVTASRWYARGGYYTYTTPAGIAAFTGPEGSGGTSYTFRIVLV